MVTTDLAHYRSEAIDSAHQEIQKRGINISREANILSQDENDDNRDDISKLISRVNRDCVNLLAKPIPGNVNIIRPLLRTAAITVITFCEVIKFKTGGWFILFPGMIFYPVIGLFHYYFHSRAIRSLTSISWAFTSLIAVSHLLLILAFLLQEDMGDGPSWLTITALLEKWFGAESSYPWAWWPSIPYMNVWVFLPVFVTWKILHKNGVVDKECGMTIITQ